DTRSGRLTGLGRDLLERFFAGPDADVLQALVAEVRVDAVHRLLNSRLFLTLEQRVVLERISVFVVLDRHCATEPGVLLFQSEVFLDHLRENRRCLYRHKVSSRGVTLVVRGHDNRPCRGFSFRKCQNVAWPAGSTRSFPARLARYSALSAAATNCSVFVSPAYSATPKLAVTR